MTDVDRMTCEEALRLLAAYIDGELTVVAQREVHKHLDACRSCYSRAEFERRLKAQLAALGAEPVRPELEDRVRTLIREFTVAPALPNAYDQ